ncbi:MAG: tetratricopeptide repeat protein [Burkholderiales bacterium]|jgi:predicted negative regulator of RcsB-dependent stress response|nr:tetratricopeptide repeat protein [Burkholderiales bacterium]
MAYDLEEQEQLENLRAFWKKYGNFILTVVIVVALAAAGWGFWNRYQNSQAQEAAAAYQQLMQAAQAKDVAKVRESAGVLFDRHGGSAYGGMAALVAARAYIDAGDAKAAKVPLRWAIDNAHGDEFRHVARLRLATVLLDEKAFDEGLKVLDVQVAGPYAAEYADRRGDLLLEAGRADEARSAYQQALDKLAPNSPLRRLIQLKLDALGTGAAA